MNLWVGVNLAPKSSFLAEIWALLSGTRNFKFEFGVKYVDFGATYFKVAFIRTRSSVKLLPLPPPLLINEMGGREGLVLYRGRWEIQGGESSGD